MIVRRRTLLQSAVAGLLALAGKRPRLLEAAAPYDAFEKSISDLQADMEAGKTSAAELVRFYLDRIDAYDQAGPRLNAVLFLNPNAGAEARALDAERHRKKLRGPLHGIPVLLKDNFDTRDMPTTGVRWRCPASCRKTMPSRSGSFVRPAPSFSVRPISTSSRSA